MLEKATIPDEDIIACLQGQFSLPVSRLNFLPIGADYNTFVYQAFTGNADSYFVKLRRGDFDTMSVIVPRILQEQGISQIIAPLTTETKQLFATINGFTIIVYPYIAGRNGYETELTDEHWRVFGKTLKQIHTAEFPPEIVAPLKPETFTSRWRDAVKAYQQTFQQTTFADSIVIELAHLMNQHQAIIGELVHRAEALATKLSAQTEGWVMCHADIHAGNILIDEHDKLYIVDWDTLIFAPKERDLMYAGGGQFRKTRTPNEEETLFYVGYGEVAVNPQGIAYYRYERIVQDIFEYCKHILATTESHDSRAQSLRYLRSQFQPNDVIDIAFQQDRNTRW
jgi:spectinomycin phosphotransferase